MAQTKSSDQLRNVSFLLFTKLIHRLKSLPFAAPMAIHHLRVEVKRLHAWLKFLHWANNKKVPVEPEKISRIFSAAGKLRELQVETKWLSRLTINKADGLIAYRRDLVQEQKVLNLALQKVLKSFDRTAMDAFKRSLRRNTPVLKHTDASKYIERKYSSVKRKFGKELKKKHLHMLRKELKDVYYVTEVLNVGKGRDSYDQKTIKCIAELLSIIGKWHDISVNRKHLKHFRQALQSKTAKVLKNVDKAYRKREQQMDKKAKSKAKKALARNLIIR